MWDQTRNPRSKRHIKKMWETEQIQWNEIDCKEIEWTNRLVVWMNWNDLLIQAQIHHLLTATLTSHESPCEWHFTVYSPLDTIRVQPRKMDEWWNCYDTRVVCRRVLQPSRYLPGCVWDELNSNTRYLVEHNAWYQVWGYQVWRPPPPPRTQYERLLGTPSSTWYKGLPGTPFPQYPVQGVTGYPSQY